MIRIFIGYDEGEKIAFHVLSESIRRLSSEPVSIVPLDLNTIRNHFKRDKQDNQSTEFAFSRFMVPYLSNYEGWSIFMDCDMMVRTDINTLWNMRDDNYAVMCVQHDYEPKQNVFMEHHLIKEDTMLDEFYYEVLSETVDHKIPIIYRVRFKFIQ